jgi:hypothetical protein
MQLNFGCLCDGHAGVWGPLFAVMYNTHQQPMFATAQDKLPPQFWVVQVVPSVEKMNVCDDCPQI